MPKIKIAVLGAGMVGRAIAVDLSKKHSVTSFDISEDNLKLLYETNPKIKTEKKDLSKFEEYSEMLKPYKLVVNAVPGFMGYKSLESIINAKKDCVDISFFPENALDLDELAKKKKVTVITDCGVAPGMSNLILGRIDAERKVDSFECYVGGIPRYPEPPFYYKAPFSPVDVIQEYLRPCKIKENGNILIKEALSERQFIPFKSVHGVLEAFNTDGLRSLIHTMPHIPEMKEKTLRYKGHIDIIIALRDSGLLSDVPVFHKGKKIVPLELTSQLLIDQWKLGPNEEEMTIMKVIVYAEGREIVWDLVDYYDYETKTSSMARSTGYTCNAAVELILSQRFSDKGVSPPEIIGKSKENFDFILNYLKERNVNWKLSER